MTRRLSGRVAVMAAAALLAVAVLAPVGVSAAAHGTARAAADASPSPTASLIPAGCPDVTDGRVPLETIIATGPAKMIECLDAAGVAAIEFEAYFPSAVCTGCGGISLYSISPTWLSGGLVTFDVATGVITSAGGIQPEGMRVATGPEPGLIGDEAATAWFDANVLDLRLPPGIGKCDVADTTPALGCTVGRYTDQVLRFRAHYEDPAAATCKGEGIDGPPLPAASVRTYCDQQLVVDSFVVTAPHVCPVQPYTIGQLSHFTDDRLVACLGSRTIAITAYVPDVEGLGRGSLWGGTPAWLVQEWGTGIDLSNGTADGAQWRLVRVPPRLGVCWSVAGDPSCPFRRSAGKWVKIVGHFADPLSATCKGTWTSPAPKPAYFTADFVHQYCREQFVLSAKPVAAKQPKNP